MILVTLLDHQLQGFKKSPNCLKIGIFDELLPTQNENVARFARNFEWDFFCDFQTLWTTTKTTLLSNISTTLKYKNPEFQFDFLKLWLSKVQDLLGHPVQVFFMVVHLQFSVSDYCIIW